MARLLLFLPNPKIYHLDEHDRLYLVLLLPLLELPVLLLLLLLLASAYLGWIGTVQMQCDLMVAILCCYRTRLFCEMLKLCG